VGRDVLAGDRGDPRRGGVGPADRAVRRGAAGARAGDDRPYGLDADDIIGGQPAAIERHTLGPETTEIWWQLSPPGFPDRWIEVHAVVAGLGPEQDEVLQEITQMLESLKFRSGD
jgi:hypothetical protein